jgi:hypothetical protein
VSPAMSHPRRPGRPMLPAPFSTSQES